MVSTESGLILLSEARPRGDGTGVLRVLHMSNSDTLDVQTVAVYAVSVDG